MQIDQVKIGCYQVGSVSQCSSWILIFIFCFLPLFSISQNTSSRTLQEALLDLAKIEKVSIVFTSNNIPLKSVSPLPSNNPIKDRLKHLLKGTELFFEMKEGQIFLFKKHKVYGYIEDEDNGERLISATIYLEESGAYEVTNNFGYFSLSTKFDTLNLEVSYVGYKTKKVTLKTEDLNRAVNIKIAPDNSLGEVLITDKLVSTDERKYIELDKGSDILLTQNQAITALGGEPDIFQTLVRQSGVSSGTDGIGGIHVRGGKNDQNLILVDGVKLYNAAHSFGMFSIVSSSVVDQIRLHKTGAAGSASGRLSSVLEVRTKDPSLRSTHTDLQLSTLAGQATVEVPLIKDRLGVLLSGRKTYIDPFVDHISNVSSTNYFEILNTSDYGFYDINMKLYGKVDKKNKVYFSLYQGEDKYTDIFKDDFLDFEPPYFIDQDILYKWQNRIGSVRWNSLIGKSSFMNFQVSGYRYDYRNKFALDEYDEYYEDYPSFSQYTTFNSQITEFEVKLDFETILPNHHLKYGVNLSQKSYQIGEVVDTFLESTSQVFIDINNAVLEPFTYLGYGNKEMTLYFSDKLKLSNSWLLEGGIYQKVHISDDAGFELEPIFGTSGYIKTLNKINRNVYIGGSIGSYIQTEHLLTTADNGYPNDIWVPSTDLIPFQRSNQIELFSEIEMGNHNVRLSTYYKKQTGILRYTDYASLPSLVDLFSESWEFDVHLGEAVGYGLEMDYSYRLRDRFSMHVAYSYGKMDYQFDGINEGAPFPFDYSIPHTVSIGSNLKIISNLRLVLDWFYSSGKPYTLYETGDFYTPLDLNGLTDDFTVISNENEYRQPDVHKLSLMLSTHWKWSSVKNNLSVGVQNIYNRKNTILQYQLYDGAIRAQEGFPILPMFLWRVEF